jgi:hypothetical protein
LWGGEVLGEEGGGGLEGADAAQPQFADEAVLQRGPKTFDAALALALRGLGGDVTDAEIGEHAGEGVCIKVVTWARGVARTVGWTAQAVGNAGEACGVELGLQPPEVARGDGEGAGGGVIADTSRERRFRQARARGFLPAHSEGLHKGRTFLLNSQEGQFYRAPARSGWPP